MSDESYTFEAARLRLEDIVAQVRRKDMSLEKSLDLLEEGVKFVNVCTEQIDHTQWRSAVEDAAAGADGSDAAGTSAGPYAGVEGGEAAPEADDEPAPGDTDMDVVTGEDEHQPETCEDRPGGAEAFGDIPSEDPHVAQRDTEGEPDPDVEV